MGKRGASSAVYGLTGRAIRTFAGQERPDSVRSIHLSSHINPVGLFSLEI